MTKNLRDKLVLTLVNTHRKRWRFPILKSLEEINPASIDWAYGDIKEIMAVYEEEERSASND